MHCEFSGVYLEYLDAFVIFKVFTLLLMLNNLLLYCKKFSIYGVLAICLIFCNIKQSFADEIVNYAQVTCLPEFEYFAIHGFNINFSSHPKYYSNSRNTNFKNKYNVVSDDGGTYECVLSKVTLSYAIEPIGDLNPDAIRLRARVLKVWRDGKKIVHMSLFNRYSHGMEKINFLEYAYHSPHGDVVCIRGRTAIDGYGVTALKKPIEYFEPCYYLKQLDKEDLPLNIFVTRKYNYKTPKIKYN